MSGAKRTRAARHDADLEQRGPEAVAGMGVIMPEVGRSRAGGGADEDEAEVGLELVGETVHRYRDPVVGMVGYANTLLFEQGDR